MQFPREYAAAFIEGLNTSIDQRGVEALTDVPERFAEVDNLLASYGLSFHRGERASRNGTFITSETGVSPKLLMSPFEQVRNIFQDWTGLA
eukprot:CAMPEP_0169163850 /NCGR_PEP_ID=MMETSP1015-20121227/58503_1 /TAXON_ID=342587 /ORGANISM="Karlodinium micrum, Strain CCMP2283" /LENGTH=90 /DNA_ID=CAMNT_0009236211 /DNA_START=51 /DNA_END=320 /DNA_ORIENTATION=-